MRHRSRSGDARPRISIITGARSFPPMGLEGAERLLLQALRERDRGVDLSVQGVGGRSARSWARSVDAQWVPWLGSRAPVHSVGGADLVHLTGLSLQPPRHRPYAVTVHDCLALRFDDEAAPPPWFESVLDRATGVLTVSSATTRDLVDLGVAPEKIHLIHQGPQIVARTPGEHPAQDDRLTVLRSGGYTKRKNVGLLLNAWPDVHRRTGARLLLTGPNSGRGYPAEHIKALADVGVEDLGYVSPNQLRQLYETVHIVVSPSIGEGFGLPALEAMASGVPFVGTRTPFFEELCGDAAVLAEAEPDAFGAQIVAVLSDAALRTDLAERGLSRAARYTWEGAALDVVRAYGSMLDEVSSPAGTGHDSTPE